MTRTGHGHPIDRLSTRSYWLEEALSRDPGTPCPPLRGDLSTDVCVVGGGFSGLWAAYELRERDPSLSVVLLEADICGSGGSGANGGFLDPGWPNVLGVCSLLGEEEGIRYLSALAAQTGEVRAWCARHDADISFHEEGVVFLRADEWQPRPEQAAVDLLASHGLGDKLRILDTDEVQSLAQLPRALGGVLGTDVATVQPGRLARELRRVLLERGVQIYENTSMTGLASGQPVHIKTDTGTVRAQQVIITTGAWAAGMPAFRRAFCPTVHSMVISEPIPDLLAEIGWTSHVGFADMRSVFYYMRRTDDARVAIGGGDMGVIYDARMGRVRSGSVSRALTALDGANVAAEGMLWLLPQLKDTRFEAAWTGLLDVTAASLPFFVSSTDRRVHAGLGFSGHGLAPTKVGAKTLASLALQENNEWTDLAVVGPPMSLLPPEPFRWLTTKSLASAITWSELRQQRGRSATIRGRAALRLYTRYRNGRRPRGPGMTIDPDFSM